MIERARKWGLAVHDSHFGLIKDNVVHEVQRAGIVTEDGSESHNLFQRNLVAGVSQGDGFWLNGIRNTFVENVVADVHYADNPDDDGPTGGAYYMTRNIYSDAQVKQPKVPGADPRSTNPAEAETVDFAATNLERFDGNEAYGSLEGVWTDHRVGTTEHVLTNLRVWHMLDDSVLTYGAVNGVTIDGLVSREASLTLWAGGPAIVRHSNIQAAPGPGILDVRNVFTDGMSLTIEDTYLRNHVNVEYDLAAQMDVQPITDATIHTMTLQNVRFAFPTDDDGTGQNISLSYVNARWGDPIIPVIPNRLMVRSYNGTPGDDFQVYFLEQAASFPVPYTYDLPEEQPGFTRAGAPVRGLNNAQAYAQYGVAIAGAVAPCSTTRPGIHGYLC